MEYTRGGKHVKKEGEARPPCLSQMCSASSAIKEDLLRARRQLMMGRL